MSDPRSTALAVAERVVLAARALGIETALIGAAAMAVHHHVRATKDVDLATVVDPRDQLRTLEAALAASGLHATLRMPDADDALGGVLVVWEHEDEDGDPVDPVEVVNFWNPYRPTDTPGRVAIERALSIDESSPLRCVRLPDLIALKLHAGSRRDHADIVDLLVANPGADVADIRATAGPYDRDGQLDVLIAEATALRARSR
jgi:predicted nucleotidyltransferase